MYIKKIFKCDFLNINASPYLRVDNRPYIKCFKHVSAKFAGMYFIILTMFLNIIQSI